MELSRSERELNKPTNWGLITYNNINARKEKLAKTSKNNLTTKESIIPSNPAIRDALEQYPVVSGPLDASELINSTNLSDNELCDFFAFYTKCKILILRDWSYISSSVLRSISITFGSNLTELDLSNSTVNHQQLEVIFVHTTNISILTLNKCENIETISISVIVRLLNMSLKELYLNSCPKILVDPLLWIGGCIGFYKKPLGFLKVLDVGECPIEDRGLTAVASGCKLLRYLNLFSCVNITDVSIIAIASSCSNLQVVNLANCTKLTSRSIISIGKNCSKLQSINLSRCSLVTDTGVKAIADGCRDLQACNLAGMQKLTENAMYYLATSCPGLLMLNLTGCEKITVNGLEALISGLDYVEKGISFSGFKPKDQHIELKLSNQLTNIRESAKKQHIETKKKLDQQEQFEKAESKRIINKAASLIQNYMYRYKLRMHFYRLWRLRVQVINASLIQRIFRGFLARDKARQLRIERDLFYSRYPYALIVQRNVRGHLCRINCRFVKEAIKEMCFLRNKEIKDGLTVRIQCICRRFLAKKIVYSLKELRIRRNMNRNHAIFIMQQLVRRFISKLKLVKKQRQKVSTDEARRVAGMKIFIFCRDGMIRYKSRLSGGELKRFYREKWTSSTYIQSVYRGYTARERVHKMRIELATMNYACTQIQRIYRGAQVLHWRDIRLNVIAAFILDRQFVERRSSVEVARLRYRQYIIDNRADSASEDDDDVDDSMWIQSYDAQKAMIYWQNYVTNEITYDEPPDPDAHVKDLIYKRIKVLWVLQKKRHRIEYDDGDHEWINLAQECERVQIQQHDGAWIMYVLYKSSALINEISKAQSKKQKENFKKQAYEDALQWKLVTDSKSENLMFLSNKTGEIRTGLKDAMDWIIQDDGLGFPCFYNARTSITVYEDPRFLYDVDENIVQQRKYIMQELRFSLYICKDMWE
eukprot:gene5005-6990_t